MYYLFSDYGHDQAVFFLKQLAVKFAGSPHAKYSCVIRICQPGDGPRHCLVRGGVPHASILFIAVH